MEDFPHIKKYPCAIEKEKVSEQKKFKYLDDILDPKWLEKYKIEPKNKRSGKQKNVSKKK
tara:strand:+ start:43 stop:222 length:180 start_codon:yes stop_codon:yes gene_type:complete